MLAECSGGVCVVIFVGVEARAVLVLNRRTRGPERLGMVPKRGEGWAVTEKVAWGSISVGGPIASSFWPVLLFPSSVGWDIFLHTSKLHSPLNEPGMAIANASISESSVRLSNIHRTASASRSFRHSVSSI